ncbi:collagen alpha-1(I) chain-like [Bos taurus]|uniref:collagen alpha-1(I) chain-like n=1 Tax=Bos taurus TaxID=9913 RepID=UPI0028CB30C6|nr:collagen alpha-1(I) chain-like [Bos taurus]
MGTGPLLSQRKPRRPTAWTQSRPSPEHHPPPVKPGKHSWPFHLLQKRGSVVPKQALSPGHTQIHLPKPPAHSQAPAQPRAHCPERQIQWGQAGTHRKRRDTKAKRGLGSGDWRERGWAEGGNPGVLSRSGSGGPKKQAGRGEGPLKAREDPEAASSAWPNRGPPSPSPAGRRGKVGERAAPAGESVNGRRVGAARSLAHVTPVRARLTTAAPGDAGALRLLARGGGSARPPRGAGGGGGGDSPVRPGLRAALRGPGARAARAGASPAQVGSGPGRANFARIAPALGAQSLLPAGGVSGGGRVGRKWRENGGRGRLGARGPRGAGGLRWDARLTAFPARAAPWEPAAGPRWESGREWAGARGVSRGGLIPRACSSPGASRETPEERLRKSDPPGSGLATGASGHLEPPEPHTPPGVREQWARRLREEGPALGCAPPPQPPGSEPRGPLRPPRAEGVQVCSEDEWCVFRGAVSREPRPSLRGGNGRGLDAASGGPEALAAGTCAVASSPAAERFQSPGGGGARPREWASLHSAAANGSLPAAAGGPAGRELQGRARAPLGGCAEGRPGFRVARASPCRLGAGLAQVPRPEGGREERAQREGPRSRVRKPAPRSAPGCLAVPSSAARGKGRAAREAGGGEQREGRCGRRPVTARVLELRPAVGFELQGGFAQSPLTIVAARRPPPPRAGPRSCLPACLPPGGARGAEAGRLRQRRANFNC